MTASRSRSSHYSVPSPSASMISSGVNPLTNSFDSVSFSQPGFLSSELPVDPRLDELSFGSHSGRASPSTFTPNVEPWGPHNLRNSSMQHLSPHVAYNRFSNGPGSVGKHSAPRSDSGYQSQSAISNEYGVYNPDSQHVMSQVNSQHRGSVALAEPSSQPQISSDQRSQVRSRNGPQDNDLKCSTCNETSKCKSDHKCVPMLSANGNCMLTRYTQKAHTET